MSIIQYSFKPSALNLQTLNAYVYFLEVGSVRGCVCDFLELDLKLRQQSGEQPGSGHGQVGLQWQQPSLQTATVDGETTADTEMSQEEGRRFVM